MNEKSGDAPLSRNTKTKLRSVQFDIVIF